MNSASRRRLGGMSLLELLVAITIMAFALAGLYRIIGTNLRNARLVQDQQNAILLAQSLLASKDAVAETGWNESGTSAGYGWAVRSEPYHLDASRLRPGAVALHFVEIKISWDEVGNDRSIVLHTLRPQRRPIAGSGGGS